MTEEKENEIAFDFARMVFSKEYDGVKVEDFKKIVCEKHNISLEELNKILEKYN